MLCAGLSFVRSFIPYSEMWLIPIYFLTEERREERGGRREKPMTVAARSPFAYHLPRKRTWLIADYRFSMLSPGN